MYIKSIAAFISDVRNDFQDNVINVLLENRGVGDDEAEVRSWEESLPVAACILERLPEDIRRNAEIVLEAKYHIEEKRADMVIVGTRNGAPVMIIIENKRWSDLSRYVPTGEYCLEDPYHEGTLSHPCRQVGHYRDTLMYTNQVVQTDGVNILTAVLLQNATEDERSHMVGPFDPQFDVLIRENPVFIGETGIGAEPGSTLCGYIAGNIDGGVAGLAGRIYSSPIRYSREYANILANIAENIDGFVSVLDDMQIELFDEIADEVCRVAEYREAHDGEVPPEESSVYLVEGGYGTGKTFVAVALLSYLYRRRIQGGAAISAKLLIKNRSPRLMVERAMHNEITAVTYALKNDHNHYDCLICDESHRLIETIWRGQDDRNYLDAVFGMGGVSVLFYDERQHVHVRDYVTRDSVYEAVRRRGIPEERVFERRLVYQHRCVESRHFMDLISSILFSPQHSIDGVAPFTGDEEYQVALVQDPQVLLDLIREKNSAPGREGSSRVLAGKGRTNDQDWNWWTDDQDEADTIGPFRNLDRKFRWNRVRYDRGNLFALDDGSVGRIGCIDSSQGLDFEYAGVIIAPDLIYNERRGRVEVDIRGHQQTDPNTGIFLDTNPETVWRIILNTYGVLLSRGRKGCYIYCCDEALQNYLGTIIPTISRVHDDGRKTGVVTYVNTHERYAYITGDDGVQYAVSSWAIGMTAGAEHTIVNRNRVSFTVWTSSTGKKYANDIRTVVQEG